MFYFRGRNKAKMNIQPVILRIAILFLAYVPYTTYAQSVVIPNFEIENKGKSFVKQNDKGYYFTSATYGDGDTVFYCKDMSCYKLIDSNGRTKMDGEITVNSTGQYVRNGKWTVFYGTGVLKSMTYYCMDKQAGLVQTYHPNGVLASRYSLTVVKGKEEQTLKTGLYQEFYENGPKKVEGFYQLKVEGQNKITSEKTGKWMQYDAYGKMVKEDIY
jgi:antitoxin component YwqK of YwqJK toxin-antitoxin module